MAGNFACPHTAHTMHHEWHGLPNSFCLGSHLPWPEADNRKPKEADDDYWLVDLSGLWRSSD